MEMVKCNNCYKEVKSLVYDKWCKDCYKNVDDSAWTITNPNLFEYDRKNQAVDVFVRNDPRCPFPFHMGDWFHQGFWVRTFIHHLKKFFKDNDLPYRIEENEKNYGEY